MRYVVKFYQKDWYSDHLVTQECDDEETAKHQALFASRRQDNQWGSASIWTLDDAGEERFVTEYFDGRVSI